jgi:zinc transporter, ZIP family
MNEYLAVLGLAALPAAANFLGGVLGDLITLPRRTLNLVFEWVAGMLLAVVGIELVPRVLHASLPWLMVVLFVAGAGLFLLIEESTKVFRRQTASQPGGGNPLVIFSGILVDLFLTGVMIGTGVTVELRLGLLLALSLMVADAPEGFISMVGLRDQGISRASRLALLAALALSVLLGATAGYVALSGQSGLVRLGLLALTAGMLMTLVIEEIVPEAQRGGEAEAAAFLLVGGFATVALLSVYVR